MELINHYCHGYAAIAVILNLEKKGVFTSLEEDNRTFEELSYYFRANSGHLNVALNLLLSLGWLELFNEKYILTEKSEIRHKIPHLLLDLYSFSVTDFLTKAPWEKYLKLVQNLLIEKNKEAELWQDMLKGVILAPLLLSLRQLGVIEDHSLAANSQDLLGENFTRIVDLLTQEKWIEIKSRAINYTPIGAYFFKRIGLMAVTVSYQPLFEQLNQLLFGDLTQIFGLNAQGYEKHIDRQLNVIGSGLQHHLFFEQFKLKVLKLFADNDFDNQPAYIADMGCGDGSLLKKLYTAIVTETSRGKVLDTYPLTMIGADFNETSLQETIKTLEHDGIPYIAMRADVGNPKNFIDDLEAKGINPSHVLHVRSFLDHDRPYISPDLDDPLIQKSIAQRKRYCHEGVFANQQGEKISPEIMVQSLVEHFGRWGRVNLGYGLILSEAHYLSPYVVRDCISESENLSFDACQGFSKQYLVTMKDFLLAAAEQGLFTNHESFTAFPKNLSFSRVSCLRLDTKPYKIRYAAIEDAEALTKLEQHSGEKNLQNRPSTIKQRLQTYPLGHWVLEVDQKIVGVIYTQRLKAIIDVCKKSDRTIDLLHHPQGKIMQILDFFVDPNYQSLYYDFALRDFALLMAKVTPGITEVISITRCLNYAENRHRYATLSAYIAAKNQENLSIDPTLSFHQRGGATIEGLIANYRLKDEKNNKAGILIRYDLEKVFA